jgi:hypothetical protein
MEIDKTNKTNRQPHMPMNMRHAIRPTRDHRPWTTK